MDTNTTRRNLLRLGTTAAAYAAGATIVTSGVALASQAKGAEPGVSPPLASLVREFDVADAALARFYEEEHNPTINREYQMHEANPHIEREIPTASGHTFVLSTARRLDIAQAKHIATAPIAQQSKAPHWLAKRAAIRSFYAAHLRRERALVRIARELRLDELRAREDRLFEPYKATRAAITAYPVASLADLHAKVVFFAKAEMSEGDELYDTVSADIRLLAGEVRA